MLIADFEENVEGVPEGGTTNLRWSRWQGPYERAPIDMNFALTDGSVKRFNDVVLESDAVTHVPDERMVRVPEGDDEWPGWRNHLPPAN